MKSTLKETAELIDKVTDLTKKDAEQTVSRVEVKEMLHELTRRKIRTKITLNLNEHGEIIDPQITLSGTNAIRLLTKER